MSDDRIAKVQAAFEKARNGKGLFGLDTDNSLDGRNRRKEAIMTTKQKPARFALYDDIQFNRETVRIVGVFTVVPHGSWVYVIRRKADAGYTCEIQPEEVLADVGVSRS